MRPVVVGSFKEEKESSLEIIFKMTQLVLFILFFVVYASQVDDFVTRVAPRIEFSGTPQTTMKLSKTYNRETDHPLSLLITFDLDDTLFPIQQVVEAANDAQIAAMHSLGYKDTSMETCMVQTRAIRQSLKSPITYTELRQKAIRAELERLVDDNQKPAMSLEEQVEHCFDAWLQARHNAAEEHLFEEVIPALEDISSHFSSSAGYCTTIGAITNGRGNPLCMTNTLAPYFAFCVCGEDDGVFPHRKPHPNIYQVALKRWCSLCQLNNDRERDDVTLPDVWVHVGDCLANDVGASHDAGARAIWVAQPEDEDRKQPNWSTATEEDREKRALLMEAARSKMSGEVKDLSELKRMIETILERSLAMS